MKGAVPKQLTWGGVKDTRYINQGYRPDQQKKVGIHWTPSKLSRSTEIEKRKIVKCSRNLGRGQVWGSDQGEHQLNASGQAQSESSM